ncbi:hypothetical protein DERP_008188 [Dermatophagoides pteronyssinus]|uniref:Uncharacterized protein n=1 Tax=Dermatophagoides pteronyssinus TaxID=6956 RepID=A0ABQ8JKF2_DERPT|nr:hypothetical protein DERP_008188 [Dermatophagoides pteronyssinus]
MILKLYEYRPKHYTINRSQVFFYGFKDLQIKAEIYIFKKRKITLKTLRRSDLISYLNKLMIVFFVISRLQRRSCQI